MVLPSRRNLTAYPQAWQRPEFSVLISRASPGRTGERTASQAPLAPTTRPGHPAMPRRPPRPACLPCRSLAGAARRKPGGRRAARSCCAGGGRRRSRRTRTGHSRRALRRSRTAAVRAPGRSAVQRGRAGCRLARTAPRLCCASALGRWHCRCSADDLKITGIAGGLF